MGRRFRSRRPHRASLFPSRAPISRARPLFLQPHLSVALPASTTALAHPVVSPPACLLARWAAAAGICMHLTTSLRRSQATRNVSEAGHDMCREGRGRRAGQFVSCVSWGVVSGAVRAGSSPSRRRLLRVHRPGRNEDRRLLLGSDGCGRAGDGRAWSGGDWKDGSGRRCRGNRGSRLGKGLRVVHRPPSVGRETMARGSQRDASSRKAGREGPHGGTPAVG